MRKIKTKAELKALGDQFPQPAAAVEIEEPQCSILEPVFFCHICSKVFESEEELTNHEINHIKLSCGLCNKNFKSKAAFEEHNKEHPSVEKMSTFQKMPVKIGKHKFECSVCKKKFKNETSLNYHDMFHTDDERKAAVGIKVTPSENCIQGKINYKDFDSEDDDFDSPAKRKTVTRKRNSNPVAKKVVEKTERQSNLTINRLQNKVLTDTDDDSEFETRATKSVKNKSSQEKTKCKSIPSISSSLKNNPKRLSRPFSEISGDSDSESGSCDSKYLSLKHISRSMKKPSKPAPVVKHYSSSSGIIADVLLATKCTDKKTKPATTTNNPTLIKKNQISLSSNTEDPSETEKITEESAPLLAISETDSEEDISPKTASKEPKINSKVQINATEVKSLSGSPKTIRRIKFSCEKCKKKFNDPMALEYHRITFHVEEDTASPATSLDRENSSKGRGIPKGNKLQERHDVSLGTKPDNKTLKSSKRAGPGLKAPLAKKQKAVVHDKTKSKCLTGIFRKPNPSDSSDDESQIKRYVNYNKSNILQSKALHLEHNAQDSTSDSDDFVQQGKVKGTWKAKKQTASWANRMKRSKVKGITNYRAETHKMSDVETFQNQKVNPKILLPDVNSVKSSSDSEEVRANHNSAGLGKNQVEDIKRGPKTKQIDMDTLADKKNKKSELKKGGELKDIYTARNRKKIDYLEISDIEESDGNTENEKIIQANNLNVANKADISSDESDFEFNKVIKKKVLKKKITKRKSDTSEEEYESTTTLKSSNIKKKTKNTKSNSSEDDRIGFNLEHSKLPISKSALKLFQKKVVPTKVSTSEDKDLLKTNFESRKTNQPKISESDKSSVDAMLLSTDEDKSFKSFYKSEDSKSEGSHFHYRNKKVHDIISKNVKLNEKMVTSDSEPEIVKKETVKTDIIEIKHNEFDGDESYGNESISKNIREKLLSTKSEKVKCENCKKTFKNSVIVQYHQLHCIAHNKSVSSGPSHAVEKQIISSKKSNWSESPVDMILKKFSEKVETSAANSPSSSPNSMSSYKFFKTKNDEVKSPTHVPEIFKSKHTRNILEVKCKICGIYSNPKNILEHIKEFHDEKISVDVKKISKLDLNRYKPDDDNEIEKAKSFDFSDEENSSSHNEEKTSTNLDTKAEKKSHKKDLNKIDNKIKTLKNSSLSEAEETKKLEVSHLKEVTGDCIGSAQFNQIIKDKQKEKSIDKCDDKMKSLDPKKKLNTLISEEDDTKSNVGIPKTNKKNAKFHEVNKCEIKEGRENVNKNLSPDDTHDVSQTKNKSQSEGLSNKKSSSTPEKQDIPQNKTLDISDISDYEVLSPVEANEKSKNVDHSIKSFDIVHSSVEKSHKVYSDQLDRKELISDVANISSIDEEPVKKKKKSKKEKKKKSKKKSKKSKHKCHNSSASESDEEERKRKRKKKHKKQLDDSEVSESPALDTSTTSVEEEKEFEGKGQEEKELEVKDEEEKEFEGKDEEEKELEEKDFEGKDEEEKDFEGKDEEEKKLEELEEKEFEGKDEEEKELEGKDEEKDETISYCFCGNPETEDMIGCDFCSMWYHPDCLGLDVDQAVSLTKSDSWLCPECQDRKGRGKPKKQETKRTSSDADNDLNKKGKKAAVKEKFPKKAVREKTVLKKQKMSKKYISDTDITDTEEETSREPGQELRKVVKENMKTNPPQNKPSFNASLKTVNKNKVGRKVASFEGNRAKRQEAKKGHEMVKKGCVTMSDSFSDSSVGVEDGSASIIRIPVEASQLNQSFSSSDED